MYKNQALVGLFRSPEFSRIPSDWDSTAQHGPWALQFRFLREHLIGAAWVSCPLRSHRSGQEGRFRENRSLPENPIYL